VKRATTEGKPDDPTAAVVVDAASHAIRGIIPSRAVRTVVTIHGRVAMIAVVRAVSAAVLAVADIPAADIRAVDTVAVVRVDAVVRARMGGAVCTPAPAAVRAKSASAR
jgi:hypothetical protein